MCHFPDGFSQWLGICVACFNISDFDKCILTFNCLPERPVNSELPVQTCEVSTSPLPLASIRSRIFGSPFVVFYDIFTSHKYCAFNRITIWLTWSPAALGSIPVSSIAMITPLPSLSLYLVRNLSTPVSRLGTRQWAGNGSNSSMAGKSNGRMRNVHFLLWRQIMVSEIVLLRDCSLIFEFVLNINVFLSRNNSVEGI